MMGAVDKRAYSATCNQAPLVTLVSASGGTGKSTLALLAGHLVARQSIRTAILEGDLQFGDMGYWLGLDVALSNLAQGTACNPVPISAKLDLFKAPVLPEVAEEVADAVVELMDHVRNRYDLVIADTGQYWSGLTGALLVSSDLVIILMDHRRSSVYGAIKAGELCQRIGIPTARIAYVLNRSSNLPRSEFEHARVSLDADELFALADGKGGVGALVEAGRIEELVEGEAAPIPDIQRMLSCLLPRIGIEFAPTPQKRRRLFS